MLSGKKWDMFDLHYEHERSIFQHTLLLRPWLESDSIQPLNAEQICVLKYDLRRYTHAIEKGLQLPVRRPGFGHEKVKCIISMMNHLCASNAANCDLYVWSLHILKQYCSVMNVDSTAPGVKDDQKNELNAWTSELSSALERLCKFEPEVKESQHNPDIWPAIYNRRSVRRWENRPVDDETLRTLVDAAIWAPSSCNRQSHRFLFVREPERVRLITELATGAKGFAEQAPCMLVLLSDARAYYAPSERHLAYIDASLAGENLALTAHDLGIGCVWLNWAIEDLSKEDTLRQVFNIPSYFVVVALLAIGYPDEAVVFPPPARCDVDECMAFEEM